MRRKMKTILFAITLAIIVGHAAGNTATAQTAQAQRHTPLIPPARFAPQAPMVQLLTANVDRSYQDGKPKNTFVVTGKATASIQRAEVLEASLDAPTLTVTLTTDTLSLEEADHLIVKVKDKIFVPFSYGGDQNKVWTLELTQVDRASAEILLSSHVTPFPQDSITVEYHTDRKPYPLGGPVPVGIFLQYHGKTSRTLYWGTVSGAGNRPGRDTQLSFTATRDGVSVPANPRPAPDGFIRKPFAAKPNTYLKRSEDLAQWLQFDEPGTYLIDATYSIVIENPKEKGLPRSWRAKYHNRFSVQIGNRNATSPNVSRQVPE